MPQPTIPLAASDNTATFQARGVAVPVTSPMLAGIRARLSDDRVFEFVMPNPSGSAGAYVVHPTGIRTICAPTMHDALLFRRLATLRLLSPATVRRAALLVAEEGVAGRQAAAAAARTLDADKTQRQRTYLGLMQVLLAQCEPQAPPDPAQITRRMDELLPRLAARLDRPPAALSAGLQVLAELYGPIGFAQHSEHARIPNLIARIRTTYASMQAWLGGYPVDDIGALGHAIAAPMRTVAEAGDTILRHGRATLQNPLGLLKRWSRDAQDVMQDATRVDWLLDGFDQLCLVWIVADTDTARRTALLEMPQLVPVLPREVMRWRDVRIPQQAVERTCRVISREDHWRTGAAGQRLISRNEQLRSGSL